VVDEAAQCGDLEAAFTQDIQPTLIDLQGDAWFHRPHPSRGSTAGG
jgi:hypothetical protein